MLQTDEKLNETLSAALTKIACDMDPHGYDQVTIDRLLVRLNLTALVPVDIANGLSFDVTASNNRVHKSLTIQSGRSDLSQSYALTHDKSGMLTLWTRIHVRDTATQFETVVERIYPRELPELKDIGQPKLVCLGNAALVLGRPMIGHENIVEAMLFSTQPSAVFKSILEKELGCIERALLAIKLPEGHPIPTRRLEAIMKLPDYIWDEQTTGVNSQ